MLSLLIGPIIALNAGMSGLFWVISGLSIIAMLIVITLPSAKPIGYYKLSFSSIKEVLSPDLLRLDFSVFSLHLILACGFIVIPLMLEDKNIINFEDNWQLYLPAIIISFVGMVPLIIASEKYNKTKLVLLISVTLLVISQWLFFSLDLTLWIFLILLSLFFISFNAVEAILPSLLSRTAGASKRGLAMGVFSTSQFLGTFIGGAIGGLIYDIYDLNSVFLLTIFMAIIWWLVLLAMPPINNKTETENGGH
jgi:predicted MFS family arabinose efflux permease